MVTKLFAISSSIFFKSYSSKNPYGNKTATKANVRTTKSYSSKNPYGNKTSN